MACLPIHRPDYPKGTEDSIYCTLVVPQTLKRSSCHPMRLEISHFCPSWSISSARVLSVTVDKDILPSLRDLIFARLSNLGLAGAVRVKLLVFVFLLLGRFACFFVSIHIYFLLDTYSHTETVCVWLYSDYVFFIIFFHLNILLVCKFSSSFSLAFLTTLAHAFVLILKQYSADMIEARST